MCADDGPQDWARHRGRLLGRTGGYMRLSEGRTFAFSLTPPSHLLLFKSVKKQNLRQGRGADICREVQTKGENWKTSTEPSCPLPSPRAVGERSQTLLFLKGSRNKGNTLALSGSTEFYFFSSSFNSWKIWPIMSWSPARLQLRGPSYPLQLFLCLQVMETVCCMHTLRK